MLSRIRNYFRTAPTVHQIANLEERLEGRIQSLGEQLEEIGETSAASQKSMRRMHLSLDHYGKLLKEMQIAIAAVEAKLSTPAQRQDEQKLQLSPSVFLTMLDHLSQVTGINSHSSDSHKILSMIGWSEIAHAGSAYHPIDCEIVEAINTTEVEAGQIMSVVQQGYRDHNQNCIRKAKVVIARRPFEAEQVEQLQSNPYQEYS
ncbi:MAG: nucleotide exchange factor GrpE [Oligoflexus sp.]